MEGAERVEEMDGLLARDEEAKDRKKSRKNHPTIALQPATLATAVRLTVGRFHKEMISRRNRSPSGRVNSSCSSSPSLCPTPIALSPIDAGRQWNSEVLLTFESLADPLLQDRFGLKSAASARNELTVYIFIIIFIPSLLLTLFQKGSQDSARPETTRSNQLSGSRSHPTLSARNSNSRGQNSNRSEAEVDLLSLPTVCRSWLTD
jgi:hypothetical protein